MTEVSISLIALPVLNVSGLKIRQNSLFHVLIILFYLMVLKIEFVLTGYDECYAYFITDIMYDYLDPFSEK